jgi:hypothetical protein
MGQSRIRLGRNPSSSDFDALLTLGPPAQLNPGPRLDGKLAGSSTPMRCGCRTVVLDSLQTEGGWPWKATAGVAAWFRLRWFW